MFSKPMIKDLFRQYTLVQLYTDAVPPKYQGVSDASENRKLLIDVFKTAQLPTYVILKPLENGAFQEISRYDEGKINSAEAFAEFLRKPLEANGAETSAQLSKR